MPWHSEQQWGDNPPVILANGERFEFAAGDSFRQKVNEVARQVGYGKFVVRLNGGTIESPSDAPESLEAGDTVELAPYNVPG